MAATAGEVTMAVAMVEEARAAEVWAAARAAAATAAGSWGR